ncbi:MAG: hypothetical protein ACR2K3_07830 [Nocardioides sp.]
MLQLIVLAAASDPVPADNDVKAGWVALVLVLLLCAAVALLMFSFVKQMRKVRDADAAGVYDDPDNPRVRDDSQDTEHSADA